METLDDSNNKSALNFTPNLGEPQWEILIFCSEKEKFLTEVDISKNVINKKYNISKYLIFENENGDLKGFYYFFIQKNKLKKGQDLISTFNTINLFENNKDVQIKDLIIIKSPVKNHNLLNKVFILKDKKPNSFINYRINSNSINKAKGAKLRII